MKAPLPEATISNRLIQMNVGSLLRYLGSFAIILSGVIYLLQGFESVDIHIRNWLYLLLMAVLAAGGLTARFLLSDVKGARIFFVIAVAIIPIQFAQLGGMRHNIFNNSMQAATGILNSAFQFGDVSPTSVGIYSLITLLLSLPISAFTFSFLIRNRAKWTILFFLTANILLLITYRDSLIGYLVVVAIAMSHLFTERELAKNNLHIRTMEGSLARIVCAIPFVIAFFRLGFHIDSTHGYATLTGMLGSIITFGSLVCLTRSQLRDFILFLGAVITCFSWISIAATAEIFTDRSYIGSYALFPCAVFITGINLFSSKDFGFYRFITLIFISLSVANLLIFTNGSIDTIVALSMSLCLFAWGIYQHRKSILLSGLALAAICVLTMLYNSIQRVDINVWITLAIGGFTLLVLSSLYERFGKAAFRYAHQYWNNPDRWQ